jgi:hypothetical protein
MIDYFLRTSTKTNMEACLFAAGIATVKDGLLVVAETYTVDMVGAADGDSRYHANLRVSGGDLTQDQLDELPILDPAPTTPMRVFA